MKILDRYIARSFATALLSSMAFLVGLYLLLHFFSVVQHLPRAKDAFSAVGISTFAGICRYYAVHLPEMCVLFGPYAVLIAGMFTIHHLDQNNELTAMHAAGVGRRRVVIPLFLISALMACGLVAIRESVVPRLAVDMHVYHGLLKGRVDSTIEDLPILIDSRGNVAVAARWDPVNQRLLDVHIQMPDGETTVHYDAIQWSPRSGWTSGAGPSGNHEVDFDLQPDDVAVEIGRHAERRMSWRQLARLRDRHPIDPFIATMLHEHVAYGFTPLILLLFGLPFVMGGRRRNAFAGIAVAIVLSLGYFSVSLICQRLGADELVLTPILGAWLPHLLFGSLGLVLFEAAS